MTLQMGPSHPTMHGVIQLTLEIDGETVKACKTQIGYLHRGFEKMTETVTYNEVMPYTDRLNYVSPLLNNVGYAMTVEKLLGIEVPERAQWIRVMAGEISRIADHLTMVAAGAMELGGFTPFLYAMKAREWVYELIEELTGHRVTTSYARVGGVRYDLPEGFGAKLKKVLVDVTETVSDYDKMITRNRIFYDRLNDTGIISKEDAIAYGFTGPCLRSTGVDYDVRKDYPYLVYDQVDFDVPIGKTGDNYDRFLIRLEEIKQSRRIIEQCIEKMPAGPYKSEDWSVSLPDKDDVYNSIEGMIAHFKLITEGVVVPPGEVYQYTEAGNGELGFYILSDGSGRPYRCRVRAPVFPMMQALAHMITGDMLADIVPTFDSINMIAGELDR